MIFAFLLTKAANQCSIFRIIIHIISQYLLFPIFSKFQSSPEVRLKKGFQVTANVTFINQRRLILGSETKQFLTQPDIPYSKQTGESQSRLRHLESHRVMVTRTGYPVISEPNFYSSQTYF